MNTNKIVIRLSVIIVIFAMIAAGLGVFWQGQGDSFSFTSLRE